MAKTEFTESLITWKRRLELELKEALDYVETGQFKTNDPWNTRKSISDTRKSLEKCQMYLSYLETINEESIKRADILQRAGLDEK